MINEIDDILKRGESINTEQKSDDAEEVDFESIENIELPE
jgi:hypothetical protein